MKKLIVLLLLLLFSSASAQEAVYTPPYGEETVLSGLALTPVQQALAEALYGPVFCHQPHIELPEDTRYDDAAAAMRSLTQDYPELFHLGRHCTIGYYLNEPDLAAYVTPQYRLSAGEAAALREDLYRLCARIIADTQDPLALHDRLCAAAAYAPGDTELQHTAPGTLLTGAGTCEGYSQALTLLYRMAGIPCGMVTGTALTTAGETLPHAWNIARLNGACTFIDVTWADQDAAGVITRWYYGLSTAQMAADHTPDAAMCLPDCGEQANWHAQHGFLAHTAADVDAALQRLHATGSVDLRITDAALYAAISQDFPAWLADFNHRHPTAPITDYTLMRCEPQHCLLIRK